MLWLWNGVCFTKPEPHNYTIMANNKTTSPITKKEDVAKSNDKKIDEDFKGFPHAPSSKQLIKPETKEEKKTAATGITDGEKKDKKEIDEQQSDESAEAFTATEEVKE